MLPGNLLPYRKRVRDPDNNIKNPGPYMTFNIKKFNAHLFFLISGKLLPVY